MVDSIFKKNKAISTASGIGGGGGGAIGAFGSDVLVLSSVFELNEATRDGGAAMFDASSGAWYNNKELLFGNDGDDDCDGVTVRDDFACFNVGENFSFQL